MWAEMSIKTSQELELHQVYQRTSHNHPYYATDWPKLWNITLQLSDNNDDAFYSNELYAKIFLTLLALLNLTIWLPIRNLASCGQYLHSHIFCWPFQHGIILLFKISRYIQLYWGIHSKKTRFNFKMITRLSSVRYRIWECGMDLQNCLPVYCIFIY